MSKRLRGPLLVSVVLTGALTVTEKYGRGR